MSLHIEKLYIEHRFTIMGSASTKPTSRQIYIDVKEMKSVAISPQMNIEEKIAVAISPQMNMDEKTAVPVVINQQPVSKAETKEIVQETPALDIDEILKVNLVPKRYHSPLKLVLTPSHSFKFKKELINLVTENKQNFSEDCIVYFIAENAAKTQMYIAWCKILVDHFYASSHQYFYFACGRLAQAYCNVSDLENAKFYSLKCLQGKSPDAQHLGYLTSGRINEEEGDFDLAMKDYAKSYTALQDSEPIKKFAALVRSKSLEMSICRQLVEREMENARLTAELQKSKAENEELKEKLYFSPMGPGSVKAQDHFVQSLDAERNL